MGRKYNCFVFALGLENNQDFTFQDNVPPTYDINGSRMEIILKHFIQTKSPGRGALVIYRNNHYINHAAIFLDHKYVLSKSGTKEALPSKKLITDEAAEFGNDITFYYNSNNFNPCTLFKPARDDQLE